MDNISSSNQLRIVVPGDYLDEGLMAGHGTYENEGKIFASLAGVVHRIDKVICVKPLKSYYRPDVGDVIVGRVVNVESKRWTVDINSYQHAILNLTSINLPGGMQRRRTEDDQIQMRNYYQENDIICAEVQNVKSMDGRIDLQTRNEKYGKLGGEEKGQGFILNVDHNFIRRMKSHIMQFTLGDIKKDPSIVPVDCVIGNNGQIWISVNTQNQINKEISKQTREHMAILRNGIVALEKAQLPIFRDTIDKVLEKQQQTQIQAKNMLKNREVIVKGARDMIEKELNLRKPTDLQFMINQQNENFDFVMN